MTLLHPYLRPQLAAGPVLTGGFGNSFSTAQRLKSLRQFRRLLTT
jgi:hypothetical protein